MTYNTDKKICKGASKITFVIGGVIVASIFSLLF